MTGGSTILETILSDIQKLRRRLHTRPELSGAEAETARIIHDYFHDLKPDAIITGLGGHGVAVAFDGQKTGPVVMLRCELDALPIPEDNRFEYKSQVPGVSHKCGHDGHMAVLAGVGGLLSNRRPNKGRAILLFQPAEETGAGAAAVLSDRRFELIKPDFAFALHNLPGYPHGQLLLKSGPVTCASAGVTFRLTGKRAHAAEPGAAKNPALALAELTTRLCKLTARKAFKNAFAQVSIVHAELGEPGFGTTPGHGILSATLRTESDETMEKLKNAAIELAGRLANRDLLLLETGFSDVFPAGINSDSAVDIVKKAAGRANIKITTLDRAFRWSEDFGRFSSVCESAFFGMGAGEQTPPLHHPGYDFPDELLPHACKLFEAIVRILAD